MASSIEPTLPEKGPVVDVESAPSSSPPSIPDDAGQDSDDSLDSLGKDIEGDLGAWACVLGSLLFLIPSFGTCIQIHYHHQSTNSQRQVSWLLSGQFSPISASTN